MIRKSTINRTIEVVFTLFGIWPNSMCTPICRIFWIITIIIVQFLHYRYLQIHLHSDDLFNLMDCLSSFLAYMKVMTKFVVFWINQRKFTKTLEMMTEDWDSCVNNEMNMHETIRKAKLSNRITNAMIILHTLSAVAYSTRIILADVDINDRTSKPPYIHKVEFPFDVNTQRTYKMILIVQTVYVVMCSWAAGAVNALLLTLVLHVGGQMDILRGWLMNFAPKESGKKHESITPDKIVQKHQKIINFSKNVEKLYTHIALLQFASNTIMICSLAFLIVSAIGTPDATEQIIRSLLFYAITNLEAFVFCFAGEYLNNKSKAIGNAAYSTTWYNLKPEDCRILSFIILRSQKQLTLTVGKMADLSLEYFASIMNASGSYLSVMLAMQ
ncbi:PREDICTED: odorant receptor 13a-like isoform X2 [Vollenhovia emeryi]|uniref:odorant receptor 13a-like isoform X2 n=1 Tax=Vollenhovia emeryi TaxID=411798 RepID=UPI0005F3735D|nr:PREDICTED: odorant receptor 13a-like isoform X2 [Vollenhovia emeryi]